MTFGEKLRTLMDERGIGVRELAKKTPCNPGYLSRICNSHKQPSWDLAKRIDAALDADGELLAFAKPDRGRLAVSLSEVLPEPALDANAVRRMQRTTPAQAEEILAHLRDTWHMLVKTDNLLGPRHALSGVCLQLGIMTPLLTVARAPQRERALRLAAQYAESAAWLYEDAGDIDRSRTWTGQAMEWAVEAGDRRMVAWVLFRRSQQATTAPEMIGLAEAAQREQRREAAPMLAAILQQSAHGLALDGAEAPALRTLDDAHAYAVTDESADATAGHGSFCTPAYLEMQRGVCWSTLGRHDRAVPAFETALAQLPDTYRRDRGVAHAGLAAAQLAENQIEPAAAAAREALAIAAGSGSARITDMVIKVTARLEPHRNLPEVAELLAELNVETTS